VRSERVGIVDRHVNRLSFAFRAPEDLSRREINDAAHPGGLCTEEHVPGTEQVRRHYVGRSTARVMGDSPCVDHGVATDDRVADTALVAKVLSFGDIEAAYGPAGSS
jgi:hypothetical protein